MEARGVRKGIQKKLVTTFLLTILLAGVVISIVLGASALWAWSKDTSGVRSSLTAVLAARERALAVQTTLEEDDMLSDIQALMTSKDVVQGHRVRVVTSRGEVVYDSAGMTSSIGVDEALFWLSQYSDRQDGMVEVVTHPIVANGTIWGHVVISTESEQVPFGLSSNQVPLLILLLGPVLALVISIAMFYSVGKNLVTPVRQLSTVVGEIASGNLSARTNLADREDEIGLLATDIDRMSRSIHEARQRASIADQALRFTVAAVSHDLRTPLTSMMAHAEALHQGVAEDKNRSLGLMVAKAQQMSQLIGDLGEIVALDAEPEAWVTKPIDIAEVLRRVVIGFLPQFEGAGIELEIDIPDTSLWVSAVPGKLERVFENLLCNVVKYAQGGKWAGVRAMRTRGMVRIEVWDRGPGIAQDDHELVFQRFYRSDIARAGTKSGSGLGLAIVRETVQKLGGTAGIAQPASGGVLFYVELPVDYNRPSAN